MCRLGLYILVFYFYQCLSCLSLRVSVALKG